MHSALFAAAVAFMAVPVSAQQWTTAQQEVIDFQERCWALWASQNADGYLRDCSTDPAYAAWGAAAVPFSQFSEERLRTDASTLWPLDEVISFELRPVVVRVVGDTANMFYWASWTSRNPDGSATTSSQKRLDVMVRRSDGWARVAAMVAPDGTP